MLPSMKRVLDSSWRAAAYMVMPRVIGLSLLPLLIAGGLGLTLGYFFWESAVAGVRQWLESMTLVEAMLAWLDRVAGASFRTAIAPLIVVALATPVMIVLSLLLVAWLMTPAIVRLVAERRFAKLQRMHGAGTLHSLTASLGWSLVACAVMLATLPLWFLIPPMVLLIPPLVWGWLTAKVMAFDVLADHATVEERRELLRTHAWPLLVIGIVCGYLGTAPALIWAVGSMALIMAPLLVPVAVWLYTLVFAFSALWFSHFALSALEALRRQRAAAVAPVVANAPEPLAGPENVEPPALPPVTGV